MAASTTQTMAVTKCMAVRRLPGSGFDAIQSRNGPRLDAYKVSLQAGKYISSHDQVEVGSSGRNEDITSG